MLKFKDFVDLSKVGKYDAITIFDVDDSLVITNSQIKVNDSKTGETFTLTPAEFNEFEKHAHHEMDFSDFKDLEILKAGKLIERVFNVLKKTMQRGRRVGIITARDDKNLIYDFLSHHGVDVNPKYIFAVSDPNNGFTGSIADRKKQAFMELITIGFRDFIFYDDDRENIKIADSLGKEIKGISIKTRLVNSDWK